MCPLGIRYEHERFVFLLCYFVNAMALVLCARDELVSQGGRTALMFASQNGRVDCARLLLGAGSDKEAKDNVCVGRLPTLSPFQSLFF